MPRPAPDQEPAAGQPAAGDFGTAGFDLALTELTAGPHRFVVEAGSEGGRAVLARLPAAAAALEDVQQARSSSSRISA